MTEARIGVYPGTFDPITTGHLDIIKRALKVIDKLVIAVAVNTGKGPLFGLDERVELIKSDLETLGVAPERIEVRSFDTLLMHFAQHVGATVIVRGLRAVSDFEYEFQMTGMNARLDPNIETVFLMASESHQFISSRLVREIASLGGDITEFVSPTVAERLQQRFGPAKK